jgi:hypothetical protein
MISSRNLIGTGAAILLAVLSTGCVSQRTFSSPTEAASALATAVKSEDRAEINRIFGPHTKKLRSGDPDQDREDRLQFARALDTKRELRQDTQNHATLLVGKDAWPFAVPVVRDGDVWLFDTEAGEEELAVRRVGRNELDIIQACRTLIDAQREYFSADRDGDGVREYARKLMSTPGQKDGLYWDAGPGGVDPSPIGPALAQAAIRTDERGERIPFHGYRFKLLTRQGAGAPGGAMGYDTDANLTSGWAAVAYPDQYAASGVMTFMFGHGGRVFEKDLGPNTDRVVARIEAFDPSDGWSRVGE